MPCCLPLLLKLQLWPFVPTLQLRGRNGWKTWPALWSHCPAAQVASGTPFSSQVLLTVPSRLACPVAVGSLHAQPVAVGRVGLSMVHPSLQGSLRQSLGKHSKGRQWFPGYLVIQVLFLGH